MPYSTFGCSLCGTQAPLRLRKHGTFEERMKWVREHYKEFHPGEFRRMIRRSVGTKKFKRRSR